MHKVIRLIILGAGLPLVACVAQPDGQDYLADATATCGARDLFYETRTYEQTTTGVTIDRTYDCVVDYFNNTPGYKARTPDQTGDRQFVATMRQIDTARSKGLLTPEQAQQQARAALAAHSR